LDERGGGDIVIDLGLTPVDAGFAVVKRVARTDRRLTNALINFDIAISFVRPTQTRPCEIRDGGKFAATCADSRKTIHVAHQTDRYAQSFTPKARAVSRHYEIVPAKLAVAGLRNVEQQRRN
jgi:hypothetical protein